MKVFGGLFGGAGGGQRPPSSLFIRSMDGFATCAAAVATVFLVPVLWDGVEALVARELVRLHGEDMAILFFWAIKLGAYPLMFFAIRMSLATTYAALALTVAMRFL